MLDPSLADGTSGDTILLYGRRGLQKRKILLDGALLCGIHAEFDMGQFPDRDRTACGKEIHMSFLIVSAQDVDLMDRIAR